MTEETTKTICSILDTSRAVDGSSTATRAVEKMEHATAALDTTMEGALGRSGGCIVDHP
jgi:hypothetical protein